MYFLKQEARELYQIWHIVIGQKIYIRLATIQTIHFIARSTF